TVGAVESLETVTVTAGAVAVLPAASRATAVSVWEPLLAVAVFHETEYGGGVNATPRLAPSSLTSTPPTPTLSASVAVTLTVLYTLSLHDALPILTVGAVESLETVTVTAGAVAVLPAASRATAVSVWEPLLAVAVFHETE